MSCRPLASFIAFTLSVVLTVSPYSAVSGQTVAHAPGIKLPPGVGAASLAKVPLPGQVRPGLPLPLPPLPQSGVGRLGKPVKPLTQANGNPVLQSASPFPSGGPDALSVAVADVNGDGEPDVLVANECQSNSDCNSGGIGVLLGNGDGTFQAAQTYASGGTVAFSLVVADVNGDGKTDVLVANQCLSSSCTGGGIGVLLGNGDGTFQAAQAYASGGLSAYSVAAADVNGDGKADVLVANNCQSNSDCTGGVVGVLLGNGDGTFQAAQAYASGGLYAYSVTVADVNGDSKPDVLVGNQYQSSSNTNNGGLGVLLGNGDGTFQSAQTYSSGGLYTYSVAVADVNGDGKADVFLTNQCVSSVDCNSSSIGVLLGNGDSTFQGAQTYSSGGQTAYSVSVADVNGDGRPDLLVANNCQSGGGCSSGRIGVLLGNGDGTFQTAQAYASDGAIAVSLAVADVNGDGRLDLLAANVCSSNIYCGTGALGVLLGNGDGSFQAAHAYTSGGQIANFAAASDVNGDGKPDLLIASACQNSQCINGAISVLLAAGDGSFQTTQTYASGGGDAISVAVADVNGDSKLDLLVANNCQSSGNCTVGSIGVLLGNGDGSFQAAQTYASGGYAALSVAVADVNGDGKPDLLVADTCQSINDCTSGGIGVLLGNGDGSFQAAQTFAAGNGAFSVAVADVNGDATPDLLVADSCQSGTDCSSGAISVLLGNGDGSFQPAQSYYSGGAFARWVAVADVNADGQPDLLVANQCLSASDCGPGGIGVLLGNADGTFQPAQTYASGGTRAFSVAISDVTGDGKPDLVVDNLDFTTVLGGNGDGTFQSPSVYSPGGIQLVVSDFNLDGKPDAAVVSAADNVTILLNISTGFVQNTTTTLTSLENPSGFGQFVHFTATVTPSGSGNPTGTVSFYDGSTLLGTASLSNGTAQFTTPTLSVGSHSVTATYSGDTNYQGSTSTPLSQVVNRSGIASVGINSDANPSSFNMTVTFTAFITPQYNGWTTGTVTFLDGTTVIGSSSVTNNSAAITTNSLAVGSHSITASYSGDSNFDSGTSFVLSQNVNPAASTTTLTSSVNPSVVGQAVLFTATVTGQFGGTPSGTVSFMNGSKVLGTGALSGGTTSLSISFVTAGGRSMTAVYSGDANFTGSTSPVLNQQVFKAASSVALTSSRNPSNVGQAVTFTATVSSSVAIPNGEIVTFLDGSTTLGTGKTTAGVAKFTTSSLAHGNHSIKAQYPGDSKIKPATSAVLKQKVN